jgi:hypothetical protein
MIIKNKNIKKKGLGVNNNNGDSGIRKDREFVVLEAKEGQCFKKNMVNCGKGY